MSYVNAQVSTTQRARSMAGVAAIHVGLGAVIIAGLATEVITTPEPKNPQGYEVEVDLPQPPPPDPKVAEQTPEKKPVTDRPIVTPPVPRQLNDDAPPVDTTDRLPEFEEPIFDEIGLPELGSGTEEIGEIAPLPELTPTPTPTPILELDPVAASPRNDRSRWVTDQDYRSIWVRRELTGTARFTVGVGTNGKVTDCTITRSSGHTALDEATCKLVTRRARFNPAKDTSGEVTQGSYSSLIRWVLPD